jgi:hypothetical protein
MYRYTRRRVTIVSTWSKVRRKISRSEESVAKDKSQAEELVNNLPISEHVPFLSRISSACNSLLSLDSSYGSFHSAMSSSRKLSNRRKYSSYHGNETED